MTIRYFQEDNYKKGVSLFQRGAKQVTLVTDTGEFKVCKNLEYFKWYYKMTTQQLDEKVVRVYCAEVDIVIEMDQETYEKLEDGLGDFAVRYELIIDVVDFSGNRIMLIGGRL